MPLASVADVVIDPSNSNTIFIATGIADGGVTLSYSPNWALINPIYTIGVYRSTNYGNTWETINSGLMDDFYTNGGTIRKLIIDDNNPNIIFAATSNGIYRTQNALVSNPTWVNVFDGINDTDTDFRSVEFQPGNSNVLYAASTNIFKSIDGGNTWSVMTGPNTGLDFESLEPFFPFRINLATTPANTNRLFAYIWGINEYDNSEVFIYYFDNNSWDVIYNNSGYFAKEWMALAVSPVNADEYYFYGNMGVYGNSNLDDYPIQYSNYIDTGVYADGHVLEFQPNIQNNPLLFFGHHAGISVGDMTETRNWEFRNTGLQNMLQWAFDDSEFEKNILITANQDCFSYFFENNIWNFISAGGDSYTARASKVNQDLFFVSSGDNISTYNKTTGDKIWESPTRPYDGANSSVKTMIPKTFSLKAFPNDTSDYLSFCEIYKRNFDWSTDLDSYDLWDIDSDIGKTEPVRWRRQITEFDYCQSNPDVIYLATGGVFSENENGLHLNPYLFKTTVGGNNGDYMAIDAYTQLDYPGINSDDYPVISGIAVHPTDPDKVWLSLIGYDNISIRVAYTINGGQTWENADPNNSLPELPVNNIVYQYGSNDALYIATDVGIYYKDATMDNWEEYGNFPHVRVTELKINYCQNKLRASTFGRSLWEGDLLPIEENPVCYAIKTGESLVWSKQKTLQTGVRIEDGGELLITDIVNMPKNGSIIIEPGGKLIIDGGKLTNGCGEPWQGIQVWGDKTSHQFPDANGVYQQGYLELKNGATIENAIIAVDLWEPENWSSTGGIVHATDAVFRNNTKSVHALHYSNYYPYDPTQEMDYNSNFKNCTFEITGDYMGTETFYKHIDLAYVKGIDFRGCDFLLDENATNISDYNHAIAGYDAKFRVSAICNSTQNPCPEEDYDKCTFTGFWSAISAVNDGFSDVSFSVNRADFINNAYGVRTTDMDNASVLFSNFEVGNYNGCGTGIYTDFVTGFAFEENEFSKYAQGPQANYFGISINNSKAVNDIYRNTFNGLSYANHSDGKNWNSDHIYEGLEYLCNTNTNNYADFYVADYIPEVSNSGIQQSQGSQELMAGNSFSLSNVTWHFYNGGEYKVDYYTDQTNTPLTPELNYQVNVEVSEIENTCPSHYGGSGILLSLSPQQKTDAEQVYYSSLNNFNNTKTLYDSYVDGGNTESELLDIQTAQPSDMWALRAQLLGNSPHLSMEVLKEAADKTDVLPESALFDILAANPDELKKDTLINYLENKEEPLPDYMISLLQQLASGITYKTALQKQMADYKHTYTRAANDIIRSILNDTIMDYTELRNWLDNIGGITSDRQIISSYLSQGNFTDAFTIANMLPTLYELKGNDSIEHLYYMDMLNLYQTLNQQGRNTHQLDSTEKVDIVYIADNSTGLAGKQAKSILEAVYNDYCHTCPNVDGTNGYKTTSLVNPNLLGTYLGLEINVKPNPAREWTSFEYSLTVDVNTGEIEIRNVSGIVVDVLNLSANKGQILWDTRNFPAGVYVYTIKCSGYSKSGKLVISK